MAPKCKHLSSDLWHTCKRSDMVVCACNSIAGGRDRRVPIVCLPDITHQWAPGSWRDTVSNKNWTVVEKITQCLPVGLYTHVHRYTGYVHIAYMNT